MIIKKVIPIILISLHGCSDITEGVLGLDGNDASIVPRPDIPSLQYSYPANDQLEVVPKSPIILNFTSKPDLDDIQDDFYVCVDDEASLDSEDFSFNKFNDEKSLYIEPLTPLLTNSEYKVFWDQEEIDCENIIDNQVKISFKTRSSKNEVVSFPGEKNILRIESSFPDNNDEEIPPFDFSTFRFTFNQPIDSSSVTYGKTIKLVDEAGQLIQSKVYVSGKKLTLDPCHLTGGEFPYDCGTEKDRLNAGERYTLEINGIRAKTLTKNGEIITLSDYRKSYEIQSSGLTNRIVMTLSDGRQSSLISGQSINSVQINSVLLGQSEVSQANGFLVTELADVTQFIGDEAIPIRAGRSGDLVADELAVKLGGYVPLLDNDTGVEKTTGNIKIRLLNDATGYILSNPHTTNPNAQRYVKMVLDLVLILSEPATNSVSTQNLLGVELLGLADIKDGKLRLSAFSMIEPLLKGQDLSFSSLSIDLVAETGDLTELLTSIDEERQNRNAPVIVAWSPGDTKSRNGNAVNITHKMLRRGDPVLLIFDQLIERLDDNQPLISIIANNNEILPAEDIVTRIDGTMLVVDLVDGFLPGNNYQVNLTNNIINAEGRIADQRVFEFTMEKATQQGISNKVSPIALTTFPGFNCATNVQLDTIFSDMPNHGSCIQSPKSKAAAKILPLTTMPSDRVIKVIFSQPMDVDSIQLGSTWLVEKINDSSSTPEAVPGRIRKSHHMFEFVPQQPWEVGSIYRYTLKSQQANNETEANNLCNNADVICSDVGYPLQTDLLVDTKDIGGPDMTIYFRVVEPTTTAITQLRNYPVRDANSNYRVDDDGCEPDVIPQTRSNPLGLSLSSSVDCLEPFTGFQHQEREVLTSENTTKIIIDGPVKISGGDISVPLPIAGRVGCLPADPTNCPSEKYIYQTFALNIELMDSSMPKNIVVDPETGREGVRVFLHPTMLVTTAFPIYLDINIPIVENILRWLGLETLDSDSGPQVLRMPYFPVTEENPNGLVPGIIVTDDDGQSVFKTNVELMLDTPNLHLLDIPFIGDIIDNLIQHNLFSYPIPYNLEGDVTIYDDGRIQIEQWNSNSVDIDATIGLINILNTGIDIGLEIPLKIPVNGQFLNFISRVSKDIRQEN